MVGQKSGGVVRVHPRDLCVGMTVAAGDKTITAIEQKTATWTHGRGGWVVTCEGGTTIHVGNHDGAGVSVRAEGYEF